jgi:carboxymethylenebutenolidase
MERLTAKDFAPQLLELYDYYAHGRINRRQFLDRAAAFTVAGMSASALLASLSPDYALAEQVEFTDPDIVAEYITYPSLKGNGQVRGYLVRPAKPSGKVGAVVVVHENRGLNPYIEDVARRVAKAGFIALAPDGLTSMGGYPGNDDKGRELQEKVDPTKLMNDFFAAIEWLMQHDASTGTVGITGFCYGGGVPGTGRSSAFLWPPTGCQGRRAHQSAAAAALRRTRHAHQRGLACLRESPQGRWQDVRSVYLPRLQSRFP